MEPFDTESIGSIYNPQVAPHTISVADVVVCDIASLSTQSGNQYCLEKVEIGYPRIRRYVICSPELSSATIELLTRLCSWFIYALLRNEDSHQSPCNTSTSRHGMLTIFHSFMASFFKMSKIPNHEMEASTEAFIFDEVSETDTRSEYSDYDNVRLNPRYRSLCHEDHSSERFLNCDSLSPPAQIRTHEHLDKASASFSSSTGEHHCDSVNSRPPVASLIITQVDVANMAKKAAYYSDARCILNFPVITFHKSSTLHNEEIKNDSSGWSWIAISKNLDSPPSFVDTIKVEDESKQKCVLCCEGLEDGDQVRILPCSHYLHVGCIDLMFTRVLSRGSGRCSLGCSTCKSSLMFNDHGSLERLDASSDSVPAWAFTRVGRSL